MLTGVCWNIPCYCALRQSIWQCTGDCAIAPQNNGFSTIGASTFVANGHACCSKNSSHQENATQPFGAPTGHPHHQPATEDPRSPMMPRPKAFCYGKSGTNVTYLRSMSPTHTYYTKQTSPMKHLLPLPFVKFMPISFTGIRCITSWTAKNTWPTLRHCHDAP